jgi:isopentenyl phosphate kinase
MDGGKKKMQADKLTFWKRKLQEYRKSGLSRRAFSEQSGVTKSTMDYWFARIRKGQKEKGLVEVKPTSVLIQNPSLQVVVADKYRIEVQRGFDPILFAEVVKALESLR